MEPQGLIALSKLTAEKAWWRIYSCGYSSIVLYLLCSDQLPTLVLIRMWLTDSCPSKVSCPFNSCIDRTPAGLTCGACICVRDEGGDRRWNNASHRVTITFLS
jgi:hypothetical protein